MTLWTGIEQDHPIGKQQMPQLGQGDNRDLEAGPGVSLGRCKTF